MACTRLKPAWRVGKGIDFTRPHGAGTPDYQIPCGKCDGCAAQKCLEWSVRLANEAQTTDRCCFVTLTYSDEALAKKAQDGKDASKLDRNDLTTFIKRLRHHSDSEIRYFACGEYGEKTRRPHYHAIIFGEDFLGGAYDISDQLYSNRILDGIWGEGITAVGEFSMASACYVAGYVNKKLNDPDTFSVMSKYPPIGYEWVKKNWRDLEKGKIVIDGTEMPIPKVYCRWLGLARIYDERQEKVQVLWDHQQVARELAHKTKKQLKGAQIL